MLLAIPLQAETAEVKEQKVTAHHIFENISELKEKLKEKNSKRSLETNSSEQNRLETEIDHLQQTIAELEESFIEVVSSSNLDIFKEKPVQEFSWNNELKIVFQPIITELQKLTDKPRQIEALQKRKISLGDKLKIAKTITNNLEELAEGEKDKSLLKYLDKNKEHWQEEINILSANLSVINQQLKQKSNQKKSFSESVGSVFNLFFKTRGRNFFLASVITALFWLLVRFANSIAVKLILKAHLKNTRFVLKIAQIINIVVLFLGMILVFLLSLYILNDWLLLILAILISIGLLWSIKSALPSCWHQTLLLINSGTVKEEQRVLYKGIPYKVKKINFYSILINPALDGGVIKLPLNDLLNMRSRKACTDEPWYPTKKNDWILIAEKNLFGKVLLQTPEVTQIELLGNSVLSIPSEKFYSLSPVNLSVGFRLSTSFGLDYKQQDKITTEIPEIFRKELEAVFDAEIPEGLTKDIGVIFDETAASSLKLLVFVDFYGKAAPRYEYLKRQINTTCVDICNKYNYKIPFEQLTVHVEKQKDD